MSAMPKIKDINFEILPAPLQPPGSLIVAFHGTGQTTADIIPHAREMQKSMPDTDFICPLGPEIFTSKKHNITREDGLRTWIRHETWRDHAEIYLRLFFNKVSVLDELHNLIDRELAARNLTNDRLGLFGFSLGGTVALMTAFTRAASPAAVVSSSGMFFRFDHIQTRPPTLWIMGDADKRYDVNLEKRGRSGTLSSQFNYFHSASIARMEKAKIPLQIQIIQGLGHDINAESLQYAARFLKQRLEG